MTDDVLAPLEPFKADCLYNAACSRVLRARRKDGPRVARRLAEEIAERLGKVRSDD